MNTPKPCFVVESYFAQSTEDTYENGEIPNGFGSWWDDGDCEPKGQFFESIGDALKAVCEANCFDFDQKQWEYDESNGYFFTDVLVDVDNAQASELEIESWKKGEIRLWNCRIHATIKKQFLPMDLTEEEIANWRKG